MPKKFIQLTTSERRGLLAILLIMAIIVAVSYFSASRLPATDQSRLEPDTILKENIRGIKDSSSTVLKNDKPRKRKKAQRNTRIYEKRNPLSQPVPQL